MSTRDRDDAAHENDQRELDLESERQKDAIMRLAADAAFGQLRPEDPKNARFFDWLAREARERQTPEERAATERRAVQFGKRMAKRWLCDVVEMREESGPPPLNRAPSHTSTAQALELAAPRAKAPYLDLAVAAGIGRELWDEECTEWVDVPADLPPGKHVALRVAGDSMTPALHDGDTMLVRIRERGDFPTPGRVVVARRPDHGYVVKQLGQVTRRDIELRSLNPAFPPIRVARRPDVILGTVVLRWCAHGGEHA
jgi:phage repressor protein C with HTH and peptisase S24 domain